MNILFLDDMPERHKAFRTRVEPHHCVDYAWTAIEAIQRLAGPPRYDVAFLDHDLGDRVYVDSLDTNSGSEVARYIAGMPEARRPRYAVLHSFNDAGAREMAAILRPTGVRIYRAMFGWPAFWSFLDSMGGQAVPMHRVA